MLKKVTPCRAFFGARLTRGLALLLPLLASAGALAKTVPPPVPPAVAVTALHALGADLAIDLVLLPEAPAKLVVTLATASGQAVGSAVLSPARKGHATLTLAGAVERFLADGYEYRLLLRDGNGAEVARPAAFTVGMSCAGEVCRFVPELGVETGAAVWLDDRLATALRTADPATPDLLAAAVAEQEGLLGAARNLAARLAGRGDGSCVCRWAYSTSPASCGDPGISLGIFDNDLREDELSAHRVRRGQTTLESACWRVRDLGTETVRVALGPREVPVAWPRVALAACGSCNGTPVHRALFLAGAHAVARGTAALETRATWAFDLSSDGSVVLSGSDVRSAVSPAGEDRDERFVEWNGTGRTIEWEVELDTLLKAPAGADRGFALAQIAYDVRSTAEAACTSPPRVEVARMSNWNHDLDPGFNPFDPSQISVVIGECRPPR